MKWISSLCKKEKDSSFEMKMCGIVSWNSVAQYLRVRKKRCMGGFKVQGLRRKWPTILFKNKAEKKKRKKERKKKTISWKKWEKMKQTNKKIDIKWTIVSIDLQYITVHHP